MRVGMRRSKGESHAVDFCRSHEAKASRKESVTAKDGKRSCCSSVLSHWARSALGRVTSDEGWGGASGNDEDERVAFGE